MWIRIANKSAKFYAKRINRTENIPKSFRGLLFSETPCRMIGLACGEETMTICLAVYIEYGTQRTDRRMDRRTELIYQCRASIC